MPKISAIPVPLHDPLEPYRFEFDNLPLTKIIRREEALNNAIEINSKILTDAIGTQGTLANRLNQSIEPNGSLKLDAMDEVLHSIGAHTDGEFDGEFYVRMTQSERDKLLLIDDEATDITLQFDTISTTVLYESGNVNFINSDSIVWDIIDNKVRVNLAFPTDTIHQHINDIEPVDSNILNPDRKNYKTSSVNTPFIEGSLKVFINGYRLSSEAEIYVPLGITSTTQTLIKFTPNHTNGTFELSVAITEDDVIRIDFDVDFT